MHQSKKRYEHTVSLRPKDDKDLREYCEKTDKKPASVIREIFVLARNGDLVSKAGRTFFEDF